MAELVPEQIVLVWTDATHLDRAALYAVRAVNAGDTSTLKEFRIIKFGGIVRTTGPPAAVTIAGNVVTFPTGLNADGVWLLALGITA